MNEIAEATKHLVRLQAVELERARLTVALKALPGEVTAAESQLRFAQKQVSDAEASLKREELSRSSLELEVASLRSKTKRHRTQLDAAQNAVQASALEHEIAFANSEIARLEDDQITSMENTEILEADRARALALVARLTETVGLIRARVGEQDLEFREQLDRLKVERVSLRSAVSSFDDGARLAHFDRIATAKGTGVAKALGQQCSGCRMGIRPQVWNQLRDGLVQPCESCSRILYYDPAMEPEPARSKSVLGVVPDKLGDLGGTSIKRSGS